MNTKELANISGISVRTLRYYDKIGLLTPTRNNQNNYREYSDGDIERLQQILFFRSCGFNLTAIQSIIDNPDFDRAAAFQLQKQALLHERKRIDDTLKLLETSEQMRIEGEDMTKKEKFSGFNFAQNPYELEARQRYGDAAIEQSKRHFASLSKDQMGAMNEQMELLFKRLAIVKDQPIDAKPVQALIDEMYHFFNQNFGYHYSLEAFAGLGKLYTCDQRFTDNIDQYAQGLSAFLERAMAEYATQKK